MPGMKGPEAWQSGEEKCRRELRNFYQGRLLQQQCSCVMEWLQRSVTNGKVAPSRGSRRKTLLDPYIVCVFLFLLFNMRVYDVTNSKVAPSRGSRRKTLLDRSIKLRASSAHEGATMFLRVSDTFCLFLFLFHGGPFVTVVTLFCARLSA